MRKQDVIEFFDRLAPQWDADMIRNDDIIATILNNAGVKPGVDVLDVACGTGVLFPDYLSRDVGSLTAVDISPEMVRIAREKFPEDKVTVCCGDVEELDFDKQFDCIVVYNAFPHFPYPKRLIKTLAGLLKEDGRLTVAHGMSREAIDNHHSGSASKVSNGLMTADSLKKITTLLLMSLLVSLVGCDNSNNSNPISETESVFVEEELSGEIVELDSDELTIGDYVILESGDKISADMRVVESHNFMVDESILTGESVQVSKTNEIIKIMNLE